VRKDRGASKARCPKRERCPVPSAQREKGARRPLPEAQKVLGALCSTLDKVLGARCPTLNTTSRNQNALSAQGRRGREADPDSRSASERGESAKREKPREQGRRHLADNSQVSDKAARRAQARAASSARHFRMPLLPLSGKSADFPRLWKIFPFAQPRQSLHVIRGQRKARPYPSSVQANLRGPFPLPRGGRTRKGGRLLLPARHSPKSSLRLLLPSRHDKNIPHSAFSSLRDTPTPQPPSTPGAPRSDNSGSGPSF